MKPASIYNDYHHKHDNFNDVLPINQDLTMEKLNRI